MRQGCIAIIGAPMDLGAGRRGVDMGPSALRLAGLDERIASLGYEVQDLGNVAVEQPESYSRRAGARALSAADRADLHAPGEMVCQAVARRQDARWCSGGDHSIAVGTVSGIARAYREHGEKIGLIWIDAHADMNTPETSPERQRARHAAGLLSSARVRRS